MIAVLYVIMEKLLGWNETVKEIMIIEFIQLIIFFIIWLVIYLRYRGEVRKLNEELQDMQEKGGKTDYA
jgi:uncharacterized membrane protein